MNRDLRGSTAVVGVGIGGFPALAPGSSPVDAMALAVAEALADSGIALSEIDGVFAAGLQLFMPTLSLCEYLQIRPRYTDSTQIGGGSFISHLNHAQAAIAAGLCDVALIAYGSTQRSAAAQFASHSEASPYETPYAFPGPVAAYAMVAQRHMVEFGTTREQLAEVAVAARRWAALNPQAVERGPLDVEDVLSSRMVATPLTVRDCCLVTDGAGAVIVTSAARARACRRTPVYVLGVGEAVTHRSISQMENLVCSGAKASGERAFRQARLTVRDVDVVQLYDAFTIMPVVFAEDLGFCAKGEGGGFIGDGRTRPGGAFPMNTNGGGLSFGHPGMYGIFTVIESVQQLRGQCVDRQVSGAEVALAHAPGGYMSSHSTAIFGTPATL
ncbi:acetyl-CoA acetyltransferase [Burkholderia pseudomallei]|uniref:acetyl-CoA acetyltransferase n=1 Tax=Burkholderia pseudomallei TaxID=28450 RepID=UPI0006AD5F22|nr:acetyl-CoA acetyltransferase [Burkholderia pseudomallei]ALB96359.1 thiolase [Burkholderia pseudomallei]ALC02410.1 thiolase [Burkholderia pseudomallei]